MSFLKFRRARDVVLIFGRKKELALLNIKRATGRGLEIFILILQNKRKTFLMLSLQLFFKYNFSSRRTSFF